MPFSSTCESVSSSCKTGCDSKRSVLGSPTVAKHYPGGGGGGGKGGVAMACDLGGRERMEGWWVLGSDVGNTKPGEKAKREIEGR